MGPTLEVVTDYAPTAPDVALLFEGGGMRAVHTAGVVETLIEAGIHTGPTTHIGLASQSDEPYAQRCG